VAHKTVAHKEVVVCLLCVWFCFLSLCSRRRLNQHGISTFLHKGGCEKADASSLLRRDQPNCLKRKKTRGAPQRLSASVLRFSVGCQKKWKHSFSRRAGPKPHPPYICLASRWNRTRTRAFPPACGKCKKRHLSQISRIKPN